MPLPLSSGGTSVWNLINQKVTRLTQNTYMSSIFPPFSCRYSRTALFEESVKSNKSWNIRRADWKKWRIASTSGNVELCDQSTTSFGSFDRDKFWKDAIYRTRFEGDSPGCLEYGMCWMFSSVSGVSERNKKEGGVNKKQRLMWPKKQQQPGWVQHVFSDLLLFYQEKSLQIVATNKEDRLSRLKQ